MNEESEKRIERFIDSVEQMYRRKGIISRSTRDPDDIVPSMRLITRLPREVIPLCMMDGSGDDLMPGGGSSTFHLYLFLDEANDEILVVTRPGEVAVSQEQFMNWVPLQKLDELHEIASSMISQYTA